VSELNPEMTSQTGPVLLYRRLWAGGGARLPCFGGVQRPGEGSMDSDFFAVVNRAAGKFICAEEIFGVSSALKVVSLLLMLHSSRLQ